MSMTAETETVTAPSRSAADLRATMAAVRLSFTWFGTRKTLTTEQRTQAADAFGAEGAFLSAGKKLLDTGHPAFKAVTATRSRLVAYWKGLTLPYPDTGIRLIRREDVSRFDAQMNRLQGDLTAAVDELDSQFADLKLAARSRLGRLFNTADYPEMLRGLFGVSWDFPSVEPPKYLRQLCPDIYRQESQRVAARFTEAVTLAEEAFRSELARLVSHLVERLSGEEDGKPKIFRDSAVDNLRSFFERFRTLSIGSSPQLDELVDQAQTIVSGIDADNLRRSRSLREHVAVELHAVRNTLDELTVDRPRRNILRRPR